METSSDGRPRFRILSLDGGGLLGTFTAAFLADVERAVGRPLASYFDLIAGTSTGGIIAAALAAGEPAERVRRFYLERGPVIFRRPWERPDYPTAKRPGRFTRIVATFADPFLRRVGFDWNWLWSPKYEDTDLKGALEEVFRDRTIGEVRGARLVLPSIDLTRGQTVVFKTPHMERLVRDRHYRIVDTVLSTTAAPTYFPHARFGNGAFVDGGLWANNPTMVAVAEAIDISEKCSRECDPRFALKDIEVLSVGTGKSTASLSPRRGRDGTAWWASNIVNLVMMSQAQGTDFQSKFVLGDRYYRVNFDVPNEKWSIDNVSILDALAHYGHIAAGDHLPELCKRFFDAPTQPYTPYP